MTAKLNPLTAAPSLMKEWHRTSVLINSSLEPDLSEFVKIRASQINGCANCLNRHIAFVREDGETEQRIYLLSAWREAPCFTDRERAALDWTEALTRLSEGHTHESAYEALKSHLTEEEQVKLTLLLNVINGWNRIAHRSCLRSRVVIGERAAETIGKDGGIQLRSAPCKSAASQCWRFEIDEWDRTRTGMRLLDGSMRSSERPHISSSFSLQIRAKLSELSTRSEYGYCPITSRTEEGPSYFVDR